MSAFDDIAASAPPFPTRGELEQRQAQRAAPAAEYNLTPTGPEVPCVNAQAALANEQQINRIERRFDEISYSAQTDHAIARMAGRAKVDFGRCD